MNQIVDMERLVEAAVPVPAVKKMTRSEKLLRWADIVRPIDGLFIYHMLEHYSSAHLADPICGPAYDRAYGRRGLFGTALADPVFREQGLTGSRATDGIATVSPQQIMDFFELSQEELHEFSCNCGGMLTGRDIARRMERLAAPAKAPSFVARAKGLFR